jgi:SAM-dependent methyltransferase
MNDVTTDYAAIAARFGVSPEIHPSDHIFHFMREHPVVRPRAAAEYFSDGHDCAVKLRALIEEQRPVDSVSILEFASGYGRVTRHLQKVIPEATLTACDIHAEAVRFIGRLGAESILSCENPDDFNAGRAFDVVFALSFFSHIPQATWTRWLRRLLDCTLPGGLLIFTTHGERSRKLAAPDTIPGDDFLFLPHSEQSDLPTEQYGTAFSPFAFVKRQIATLADARSVKFQEEYWWTHQDLYVVTRAMSPTQPQTENVRKPESQSPHRRPTTPAKNQYADGARRRFFYMSPPAKRVLVPRAATKYPGRNRNHYCYAGWMG